MPSFQQISLSMDLSSLQPGSKGELPGQPHRSRPLTEEPFDTQVGGLEGRTKADYQSYQSEVLVSFSVEEIG